MKGKMRKGIVVAASLGVVAIAGIILTIILINGKDKRGRGEENPNPTESISPTEGATPTDIIAEVTQTPTPTAGIEEPKYHVGDSVLFGKYEQDNNADNGQEDIEWIVLKVEEKKVLIISRYAIECMQYQALAEDVNWENSSVRAWLNEEFYGSAFSESEKNCVLVTDVENSDYYLGFDENGNLLASNTETLLKDIKAHSVGGATTNDRVFLLNVDEVNELFETNEERATVFTEFAREQFFQNCYKVAEKDGVTDREMIRDSFEETEKTNGHGYCSWWLRCSGATQSSAGVVYYSGESFFSENADSSMLGVRPAMWVELP